MWTESKAVLEPSAPSPGNPGHQHSPRPAGAGISLWRNRSSRGDTASTFQATGVSPRAFKSQGAGQVSSGGEWGHGGQEEPARRAASPTHWEVRLPASFANYCTKHRQQLGPCPSSRKPGNQSPKESAPLQLISYLMLHTLYPLTSGRRQRCWLLLLAFNTVLEALASAIRQEKERKFIRSFGQRETPSPLFTDMTV